MQRASKRIKLQTPCNSSASGEASKNVVITGGTRGHGWAMARDFCQAGDRVLICGRDEDTVGHATRALWGQCGRDSALGVACDVSRADDVRRLGRFARQALGDIDLWVNCAGGGRVTPGSTAPASEPQQRARPAPLACAGSVTAKRLLADVEPGELEVAVGTNVLGSLLGCREAVRLMREQPPGADGRPRYHIFNLGFSGWGAKVRRRALPRNSCVAVRGAIIRCVG